VQDDPVAETGSYVVTQQALKIGGGASLRRLQRYQEQQ
jgi:hypothetical protein